MRTEITSVTCPRNAGAFFFKLAFWMAFWIEIITQRWDVKICSEGRLRGEYAGSEMNANRWHTSLFDYVNFMKCLYKYFFICFWPK